MQHPVILTTLLLFTLPQHAIAQWLPAPLGSNPNQSYDTRSHRGPTDSVTVDDQAVMAYGGVMGGVLGIVPGVYMGAAFQRAASGCRGEDGCLGAAIIGGLAGESIGIAAGVHMGNHGRGNFLLSSFVSGVVLTAGLTLSQYINVTRCPACDTMYLIGIPMAQIAAAIAVEQATTPKPDPHP